MFVFPQKIKYLNVCILKRCCHQCSLCTGALLRRRAVRHGEKGPSSFFCCSFPQISIYTRSLCSYIYLTIWFFSVLLPSLQIKYLDFLIPFSHILLLSAGKTQTIGRGSLTSRRSCMPGPSFSKPIACGG